MTFPSYVQAFVYICPRCILCVRSNLHADRGYPPEYMYLPPGRDPSTWTDLMKTKLIP